MSAPVWLRRSVIVASTVGLVALAVAVWIHSNGLRSQLLAPEPAQEYDLDLIDLGSGRVVLPRTDETEAKGVWGLESATAYAQVGAVIEQNDETVVRSLQTLVGELSPGDPVRLDADAFPGDPKEAHGLGFEPVRVPGDLGPNPSWLVEGRRSTWVIVVHDRGDDRRQALRLIPTLVDQGFPVLVMTMRNDVGAPSSPGGMVMWGLDEWRDLEAAAALAQLKGAEDFVLIGYGMGAGVISTFLDQSDRSGEVLGVVMDSPVLDLEGAVDATSSAIPAFLELSQQLTRVRFGLEWEHLDHIEAADRFDVPILILHGAGDTVVPINMSERFAAAIPNLVRLERFEQAGHGGLWNVDAERYSAEVTEFLNLVAGAE